MNRGTSVFICTMVGAVIGSFATYKYMSKKIDTIVKEEVDKCNEFYEVLLQEYQDVIVYKDDEEHEETNKKDYDNLNTFTSDRDRVDYSLYSKNDEEEKLGEKANPIDIEIFSEKDYNDLRIYDDIDERYDTLIWTYYEDGVVAEDLDVVDEIHGGLELFIGDFDLNGYFENEDNNIVYIRNHIRRMDIEISRSLFTFDEYLSQH